MNYDGSNIRIPSTNLNPIYAGIISHQTTYSNPITFAEENFHWVDPSIITNGNIDGSKIYDKVNGSSIKCVMEVILNADANANLSTTSGTYCMYFGTYTVTMGSVIDNYYGSTCRRYITSVNTSSANLQNKTFSNIIVKSSSFDNRYSDSNRIYYSFRITIGYNNP